MSEKMNGFGSNRRITHQVNSMSNCDCPPCGTGNGNFPQPGDPDMGSAIVTVSPGYGGLFVSWTQPSDLAWAVAYTDIFRNTVNDVNTAQKLVRSAGDMIFDQSNVVAEVTYYYWVRFTSVNGTVGEFNGPGSGSMRPLVDDMLDKLTGQVRDSQLYADLKTSLAGITTNQLAIAQEISDRVTADSLAASSLADVISDLDDVATAIQTEIINRVDGQSALAGQISTVVATSNGNTAAIAAETQTRVDEDEALSLRIDLLDTALDDPNNPGNPIAVSTAISGLQTQITNNDGDITSNASAITDLETTVNDPVTGVTANSSAISGLDTRVTTAEGTVTAQGTAISGLESTVNHPTTGVAANAAAASSLNTRVTTTENQISTQSFEITALETTVNDPVTGVANTASVVSTHDSQIQTIDGVVTDISAQYMVKTDVNGYVAGFGLYNNGATSDFIINADTFAITQPGVASSNPADHAVPFVLTTVDGVQTIGMDAEVFIKDASIKNAAIGDAAITTAKIADAQIVNAKIGNSIESLYFSWNPGVSANGWHISKSAGIVANAITIVNSSGNVILGSGGVNYSALIDDDNTKPAANATRNTGALADQDTINLNSGGQYTGVLPASNTQAEVNSLGLNIKINYVTFNSPNPAEIYVHGYENGVAADVNGYIYLGSDKTTVAKGSIWTGGKSGWIGLRTTGTFSHGGSSASMAVVRNNGGQWQYDSNGTWTNFSPPNGFWIVGSVQGTGSDAGSSGGTQSLTAGTLWASGTHYTKIGAFADVDTITTSNVATHFDTKIWGSTYIQDLAVDSLQIASNAVTASSLAQKAMGSNPTTSLTLTSDADVGNGQVFIFNVSALVPDNGANPASYDLVVKSYRGGTLIDNATWWLYSHGTDTVTKRIVASANSQTVKLEVFLYLHATTTYVNQGQIDLVSFSGKR